MWVWLAIQAGMRAFVEIGRADLTAIAVGALRQEPDADATEEYEDLPELEDRLRRELGSDNVDRLLAEGAALTIVNLAQIYLDAIKELLD
jgi:hypothetical protein